MTDAALRAAAARLSRPPGRRSGSLVQAELAPAIRITASTRWRAATSCCASTARRSDEVGRATLAAFQDQIGPSSTTTRSRLFGVSVDPADRVRGRARKQIVPGIRHFWDFDGTVGRLYGALPRNVQPGGGPVPIRRFWMVLNPTLRVRAIFPFEEDGSDRDEVLAYLRELPPVEPVRRLRAPGSGPRSSPTCSSPSSAAT